MTKAERKKFIKDTFSATEVGVLIEDMQNGIQVIGEQYGDLKKEIKEIKGDLGEFKDEMGEFRNETKANFKAVFDYLSRIEDDFVALKEKVEKLDATETSSKDFKWLKNKVLEIEKKLEEYKKQQTMLSAKM